MLLCAKKQVATTQIVIPEELDLFNCFEESMLVLRVSWYLNSKILNSNHYKSTQNKSSLLLNLSCNQL